jgi:hypothetical protein
MQVAVLPTHHRLDRPVQVAERHRAGHDQSRRQTGGLAPRSVTFRVMTFIPAPVFGALVLATIFASCLGIRHRRGCLHPMLWAMALPSASGRWPDLRAGRNYGDGVDGAPTASNVPRWMLSQTI